MTYQPCHYSGGMVPRGMLAREEYAQRSYEGGPHLLHRGHTRSPEITRGWPRLGHPTSCTEKLCRWYDGTLKPLNVRLTCILADIYKAAWIDNTHKEELDRKVQSQRSESAREGLELLMSRGVEMRAMGPEDWRFLSTLCDRDVREQYARAWADEAVRRAYSGEADDDGPYAQDQQHPSRQRPFMHHCAKERGRMDRYVHAYLHGDPAQMGFRNVSLKAGRRADRMRPLVAGLESEILGKRKSAE